MREILFRGKRLDNGGWIEGDLRQYPSGAVAIRSDKIHSTIKVDPATVGQYTGLKDKNGLRIFEGDILQIIGYGELIDHCVVGYGFHKSFGYNTETVGFFLYWKNDEHQSNKYSNLPYWLEIREAVCVGNIHDNPDLIEGSESK